VDIVACLITAAIAYLLGSIPTGYLVGMAKGVDVRKAGSGNIGATNAFRILGRGPGIVVLTGDALKGWLAVAIVPALVYGFFFTTPWSPETRDYLQIVAGIVVILGHNYTCWLKFKGGKGIATSAGVLAALVPWTCVISLATWLVICLITRYVSVASIAAALSLPPATWLCGYGPRMVTVASLMCVLAVYKHKANIQRLMNGTENKVGQKNRPPATGAMPP
jgi:glycerol-3-phosphate acyltransferase PlsY